MFLPRACYINKKLICVNDNVLVKGDNDAVLVGRISSLFENEKKQNNNHCADILWYFNYNELPKKCSSQIEDGPYKHELYLPLCGHGNRKYGVLIGSIEEIDAETILRACDVVELGYDDEIPEKIGKDIYFLKYGFDNNQDMHLICEYKDMKENLNVNKNDHENLDTPARGKSSRLKARQSILGM